MADEEVDFSRFNTRGFERGAGRLKETAWLVVSLLVFRLCPVPLSALKRGLLRAFGARVGAHVVIKPNVAITFPWKLSLGDYVWLGEGAMILNLAPVDIASHVCISQRAFLCTGSHDYKSRAFDLVARPIVIERGAWIAAAAWVGPGTRVGSHAVLTAGSATARDLEPFGIYRGNPAVLTGRRIMR